MLKFIFNWDKFMPAAYAYAKQFCKSTDHFHRVFVLSLLTHPLNGIKRIVQKMRIDLRLKRLKLGLAQLGFLRANTFHKLFYTV